MFREHYKSNNRTILFQTKTEYTYES